MSSQGDYLDDLEIELVCPCSDPILSSAPQSLESCCKDLTVQIARAIRLIGNDWRGHESEYEAHLNYLRELVILRDRYYPEYQEDWGGGGGANIAGSVSSTNDAMTELVSVSGAYQTGSIQNTHGANAIRVEERVTDAWGATVTGFAFFGGPGAFFRFTSLDLANALYPAGINPPIVSVSYRARSDVAGFPGSARWIFETR